VSNGKIYGVVSDGSVDPLTRIAELERLWPIIQAKLSTYDGLVNDVAAIKKDLITIKQKHEDLKDDLNVVDSKAKDAVGYVQNKVDLHAQSIGENQKSVQDALSTHKSLISQFQSGLQEVKDGLNSFKAQVSQDLGNTVCKAALQDHKDQAANAVNVLKDVIGDLGAKIGEIKTSVLDTRSSFLTHKDILSSGLNTISDVDSRVTALANSYESYKTYVSTLVYNETKKVSADVESKIKDIKASASPVAAINTLRDEFIKKLEGVALDGTNAVLRSSNATNQISLLEKKIENILLRLKAVVLPK